jgi:glycolate oxidase FAD binding subunit
MRMHLGALGTLGVIVSANFKVVPAARAEATVLLSRHSVDALESDRQAITRSRIRPIAFEVRQVDGAWQVAVRIEGRPATVDQMARELADSFGEATTLSTEQSAEFWQTYVAGELLPASGDALVLQVRGKPTDTFKTLLATENAFQKTCLTLEEVRVAPGLGTVRYSVRVPETSAAEAGAAIKELRASERLVLVLTAPGWVQRTIDAFGLPDSTLELMRQLKRQFDPRSVLNPGRVIPEL